jgi:tripartite-type tricarboxylate transporter receptor subunit TctC
VPVLVDNKSGGTTTIGAAEVARSAPDGHTLLYTSLLTHAINPHLLKVRQYDASRDFTPISAVSKTSLVLLANNAVGAGNLQEFIAAAKAAQGRMSYGSIGMGSVAHLYGAYLAKTQGVEMVHVPFRGSAPAAQDLLGGQIHSLFDPLPAAIQKLGTGKVRAIGLAAPVRSALLPEVPTLREQGLAGLENEVWIGLFGPARMPPEAVARLTQEMTKIGQDPAFQAALARNGEEVFPLAGADFVAFVARSRDSWGSIIKRLDVKLEE